MKLLNCFRFRTSRLFKSSYTAVSAEKAGHSQHQTATTSNTTNSPKPSFTSIQSRANSTAAKMSEYAKNKPAGFKNAIEKVAIVGVCIILEEVPWI